MTWETFRLPDDQGVSADVSAFIDWNPKEDDAKMAFLCGPPGTGKTHMAVAKIRDGIERGARGALFIVVPELLANMRDGFKDGSARGVLDQAKYAKFLVLDDLGAEMATDWVRDTLYMLINNRDNGLRPTVVTSNLNPGEIAASHHERLASRLASGLVVDTSGEKDYRIGK